MKRSNIVLESFSSLADLICTNVRIKADFFWGETNAWTAGPYLLGVALEGQTVEYQRMKRKYLDHLNHLNIVRFTVAVLDSEDVSDTSWKYQDHLSQGRHEIRTSGYRKMVNGLLQKNNQPTHQTNKQTHHKDKDAGRPGDPLIEETQVYFFLPMWIQGMNLSLQVQVGRSHLAPPLTRFFESSQWSSYHLPLCCGGP